MQLLGRSSDSHFFRQKEEKETKKIYTKTSLERKIVSVKKNPTFENCHESNESKTNLMNINNPSYQYLNKVTLSGLAVGNHISCLSFLMRTLFPRTFYWDTFHLDFVTFGVFILPGGISWWSISSEKGQKSIGLNWQQQQSCWFEATVEGEIFLSSYSLKSNLRIDDAAWGT